MSPKLAVRLAAAVVLAVKDEVAWWREARREAADLRRLGCKSNRDIDGMR
jgi:hypothetical protein